MKSLKNIIKKVSLIMIIFVMLTNFIMPNIVRADDSEESEAGGKLFTPITELVLGISDRILATMQEVFIGDKDFGDAILADSIKDVAPGEDWYNRFSGDIIQLFTNSTVFRYSIRYSPGIIFSGMVPALDINFIAPKDETKTTFKKQEYQYIKLETEKTWKTIKDEYNANNVELKKQEGSTLSGIISGNYDIYYAFWNDNGVEYYFVIDKEKYSLIHTIFTFGITNWIDEKLDDEEDFGGTLYKREKAGVTTVTKPSTAAALQSQVSKWYMALRTFALVGLLSVLVYIGIRIILNSGSAQNQAKYKNMLKNWLVALCMLFVLHYVMAFILTITQKLIEIFKVSTITEIGEDTFMTSIRNRITGDNAYFTYFGYVVMYIALVILTLTYTFQYVKRVVYIAFLTMIAPLIALTYPIDKVKDGQAQAFSMWIKEYVFNCLLQPVHLLIYVLFLDTASGIITTNPIFAIIVLAFMTPAEKFFRKMFGLDKASSVSTLGAAAGGAMVMSMLNKIKSKPVQDDKEQKPSVRTATNAGIPTAAKATLANNSNGGSSTADSTSTSAPVAPAPVSASASVPAQTAPASSTSYANNAASAASSTSSSGNTSGKSSKTGGIFAGLDAVGKRYIYGPDVIKSRAKRFGRTLGGTAVGLATGTAALAANITDGDLFDNTGKAMLEIAGTTGVGYSYGNSWTGRAMNGSKHISDTYKQGALGLEEYNNRLFDKEFYKSDGYRMIVEDSTIEGLYGDNIKDVTQAYLESGITDSTKIREALRSNITAGDYMAFSKADVSAPKEMAKLINGGVDADTYKAFKEAGITNSNKVVEAVEKLRNAGVTDKGEMARRASLAANLRKQGLTNEKSIKAYFRKKGLNQNDIDEIYKQIKDVLT